MADPLPATFESSGRSILEIIDGDEIVPLAGLRQTEVLAVGPDMCGHISGFGYEAYGRQEGLEGLTTLRSSPKSRDVNQR